jgi:hypothetical protein
MAGKKVKAWWKIFGRHLRREKNIPFELICFPYVYICLNIVIISLHFIIHFKFFSNSRKIEMSGIFFLCRTIDMENNSFRYFFLKILCYISICLHFFYVKYTNNRSFNDLPKKCIDKKGLVYLLKVSVMPSIASKLNSIWKMIWWLKEREFCLNNIAYS